VTSGSWLKVSGDDVFVADPDLGWGIGNTTAGNPRDAIRVFVRDTVDFVFGKLLGWTKRGITAEAVAVWGSARSSSCIRPWAVPYQQMLDQLYPPAGTKPTSYDMTINDIANLSAMSYASNPVTLKVASNNGYTPNGQFYAVDIPPGEYADGTAGVGSLTGANNYSNEIAAASCSALTTFFANQGVSGTIGIGDWLNPETGNMQGPTHQGISGQGQSAGICGTSDTCSPPKKIIVAMWDTQGDAPYGHCNSCYHVKYLGEFSLVGWDQSSKSIVGFFNTMTLPASGAAGFTPGAISSVIQRVLVK